MGSYSVLKRTVCPRDTAGYDGDDDYGMNKTESGH